MGRGEGGGGEGVRVGRGESGEGVRVGRERGYCIFSAYQLHIIYSWLCMRGVLLSKLLFFWRHNKCHYCWHYPILEAGPLIYLPAGYLVEHMEEQLHCSFKLRIL